MSKQILSKGISTPIGILVIVLAVAIAGAGIFAYQYYWPLEKEVEIPEENQPKDETVNWRVYSSSETNFTFRYPENWEIIDDYFYETAAGIKSEQRTVILQKIGDEDSNNWIRINPIQFQYHIGKCIETNGNTIGTYSKDSEVLEVFDNIVTSFQIVQLGHSIILLSPNGGEEWVVENTYDITWKQERLEEEKAYICLIGLDEDNSIVPVKASQNSPVCSVYGTFKGSSSGSSFLIKELSPKTEKYKWFISSDFINATFETFPNSYIISIPVLESSGKYSGSSEWAGCIDRDESDDVFSIIHY